MKLENKISLALITVFLVFGVFFFMTGFSFLNFLGINHIFTYILFPLLFICALMLIGLFINRRIRKPLTFFIRWIDHLSIGIFKRPDTNEKSLKDMAFGPFSELNTKLDLLTTQLIKAEAERKELEDTRKKWTAGVTHDLKTPLSYVKGYAAMLRSEHAWDEMEVKEFAKIIEEKSLYMEQLIDDLSVIYEFDNMHVPLSLQTSDLVVFVKTVLADFKKYPLARDYPIFLNTKGKSEILFSFDSVLLKRALENFMMNAITHNPIGTMITLTVEKENNATMITINDNGIGMDDQMIEQLFTQYYRGGTTDKSHLGSGLGMSIGKQFIEKQGGHIKVESAPNKGSKIIIKFLE